MAGAIVETFQRFDKNGDGIIMREELAELMHVMDPDSWNDGDDLDRLLDMVDKNKDGKIQYAEFAAWLLTDDAGLSLKSQRLVDSVWEWAHDGSSVQFNFRMGGRGQMFFDHNVDLQGTWRVDLEDSNLLYLNFAGIEHCMQLQGCWHQAELLSPERDPPSQMFRNFDGPAAFVGKYECHEYDGGGKNDHHYIILSWWSSSSLGWQQGFMAQPEEVRISDDGQSLLRGSEACKFETDSFGRVAKMIIYDACGDKNGEWEREDIVPIRGLALEDMDSDQITQEAITLLRSAAFSEGEPIDCDRLGELLGCNADPNAKDNNGKPLVMIVTDNLGAGDSALQALMLLKDAGANLDAVNNDGVPSMIMAAKAMNEPSCWALVIAKLTEDQDMEEAKEWCKSFGWLPTASGILPRNAAGERLVRLADGGSDAHFEEMRGLLIEHKADPNYRRSVSGCQGALHVAAGTLPSDRFAKVLDIIMKAGGDVDLPDSEGRTPMHVALGSDCHPCQDRDDKVALLLDQGAHPGKLMYKPLILPLGVKTEFEGRDSGGTPLMCGTVARRHHGDHCYVEGYSIEEDISFKALLARMIPWHAVEPRIESIRGQTEYELMRLACEIIKLGFGDDLKIFSGKDSDGKKIVGKWDKLQIRHQLFIAGFSDLDEAERRARLLSEVILIPLIETLALPEDALPLPDNKLRGRCKDLCIYLLDQGVGTYCMPELRAVAKRANDSCEAMYNNLYEHVDELTSLTADPMVKYIEVCRHPYEHLEWLMPGQEDTIVAVIELMRCGAITSMADLCTYVSSCCGTYENTYYSPWNVVKNFWAGTYAKLLIGQAQSSLDHCFQASLEQVLPEHLLKGLTAAPVKTFSRVSAKQIEYSSFGEQVSTVNVARAFDEYETDEERSHRQEQLDQLRQAFQDEAMTNFQDRTAASGVIDIVRRACVANSEEDFKSIYYAVKENFECIREKNGFHPNFDCAGAGYRDLKLNLRVHGEGIEQIAELQIILAPFLDVKKLSHVPYTILRGDFG